MFNLRAGLRLAFDPALDRLLSRLPRRPVTDPVTLPSDQSAIPATTFEARPAFAAPTAFQDEMAPIRGSMAVAGEPRQTASVAGLAQPRPTAMSRRGSLSEKYESGGRGPGVISSGAGDHGGVSYGPYQLATNMSQPQAFLNGEGARWAASFGNQKPATPEFNTAWRNLANSEGEAFKQAQHDYIGRTHYRPQLEHIRKATGIDLSGRSNALQDVIWSTAVQHGAAANVIPRVLNDFKGDLNSPEGEEALIRAIYAERGRRRPDGALAYFGKSSPKTQASVANRLVREQEDALRMLRAQRSGR
jgi:hypothetical protein